MSCTEFHTGKLKKIEMHEFQDVTFEEQIEHLMNEGYEFDEVYPEDNYFYSENVVRLNNMFYEVLDHFQTSDDDQYIMQANDNPDGTISFMLQFYNGGCGFDEALEDAINAKDKN